ncbi:hypothetical protein [Verrucomicrobium sp. BvORR034]|uniref:hypothetical protein n=1 Tax=Verrucomicrobium sp. BvORR034 TaxID=1396418 RepID=UPI0006789507|nr:hypothetical protein [Verrucomicrobium sp. BvORR034]
MDYPSLEAALKSYFGEDCEITQEEDESDAWRGMVNGVKMGMYEDLVKEARQLLTRSDQEIYEYLRAKAPAWEMESPALARRSVEILWMYVDAYTE